MAKTPKKIPGTGAGDTSTPTNKPANTLPIGHPFPDLHLPGSDSTLGTQTPNLPQGSSEQPGVVVSNLPDLDINDYGIARSEIVWPHNRYDELTPLGTDTGLFKGPDQRTYAQIDNEGRFLAELNEQGEYQVPLPFAPGVPGPVLIKIDGQPRWRIERPGWQSPAPAIDSVMSKPPAYLAPHLAELLTKAELSPDGIRYDKRKKTYVDTAGGTLMVSKNRDGNYQETSASELSPSGAELEIIAGTKLWQRKAQDTQPDSQKRAPDADEPASPPSKRPRPADDGDANAVSSSAFPKWKDWGTESKPPGDSIEIEGKHYSTIFDWKTPNIAFIKNPEHSELATNYQGFEQMLQTTPQLQPIGAVNTDGKWRVLDNRLPFEKSFTQYVADTYTSLSNSSVELVAKQMFYEVNGHTAASAGLHTLFEVFHHWTFKNSNPLPRADLLDPMLLILGPKPTRSAKPISPNSTWRRLDFDPQRFPLEWALHSASPSTFTLWDVFNTTLRRDGYTVSNTFRAAEKDLLLFSREGTETIYVMRFGEVENGAIARGPFGPPTAYVRRGVFKNRLSTTDEQLLTDHMDRDSVIYLIGAKEQKPNSPPGLVVVREA